MNPAPFFFNYSPGEGGGGGTKQVKNCFPHYIYVLRDDKNNFYIKSYTKYKEKL